MRASHSSVLWAQAQDSWFNTVNHLSRVTPWLHEPARLYAEYGVVVFAGLLLVSWWLARGTGDLRRTTAALWAPVGALVALGVNQVLASAVAEPRPYLALPHPLVLVSRSADYSFPSDHATAAFAIAVSIFLRNRRIGAIALVMATILAVARVAVGVHYPGDVVAGALLGTLCALFFWLPVVRRPLNALADWVAGLYDAAVDRLPVGRPA